MIGLIDEEAVVEDFFVRKRGSIVTTVEDINCTQIILINDDFR